MRWPALVFAALAAAGLGLPARVEEPRAGESASQRVALTADSVQRGWIRLRVQSTPGVPVTITPGGHYRDSMKIGGRLVRVRQGDGIHLSTAGRRTRRGS